MKAPFRASNVRGAFPDGFIGSRAVIIPNHFFSLPLCLGIKSPTRSVQGKAQPLPLPVPRKELPPIEKVKYKSLEVTVQFSQKIAVSMN